MKTYLEPQNIDEAKKLIETYRAVNIEEIETLFHYHIADVVARKLTGYGSQFTCSLCLAVKTDCNVCVYGESVGCGIGENENTFMQIHEAETPAELLKAFHDRADHIEKLIRKKKDHAKDS